MNVPLAVTNRPANNLPGLFDFEMDSNVLLRMLRQKKDLSEHAREKFAGDLQFSSKSRIRAVTFKDEVFRESGYFV